MPTLENFLGADCDNIESDKARFEWQMNWRANYLLVGDEQAPIIVDVYTHSSPIIKSNLVWINRHELVAGSFMCNVIHTNINHTYIKSKDIDIYFKCKDDAMEFLKKNPKLYPPHWAAPLNKCQISIVMQDRENNIINLIFGVHYKSPEEPVSRFDIRACSIACDPSKNTVYAVKGALMDCSILRIVYNPVPHNTTIARLIKYTQKGFSIDPYQRLFFAELIRSSQYNPELELSTGYRKVKDEDV